MKLRFHNIYRLYRCLDKNKNKNGIAISVELVYESKRMKYHFNFLDWIWYFIQFPSNFAVNTKHSVIYNSSNFENEEFFFHFVFCFVVFIHKSDYDWKGWARKKSYDYGYIESDTNPFLAQWFYGHENYFSHSLMKINFGA